MKTQLLKLALPVRARRESLALHQEPLLPACAPELLCDDALEPKPLRDTCVVPMALLPGRAAVELPSLCRLRVLP